MVGGMSASVATGFSGCEGIVASVVGEGWRLTTRAIKCPSGPKLTNFLGLTGPQQGPQYGMVGPSAMPRKEFGFGSKRGGAGGGGSGLGLGRRGGTGFLWLLARASTGDKSAYSDGGSEFGGGGGGVAGGGGRPGSGPGGGHGGGEPGHPLAQALPMLWIWYNGLLETHPLVSKSLTAGLLNAIADLFCQVFVEKLDEVDWKRLFSFASIGLCLSGPGLHFWYGALPKIVTLPGPGGVLLRIALDQLVFTPLGMVTYFVVLLTLEDRREDIRAKLEKDWWPTVVTNWKVWVPFQIVNFGFVPPQLQVAAAGLLGVVWSVYISYKGHT